jgi:hypothetical protein
LPLLQCKQTIADAIKESGLEYSFIFNGYFMDTVFHPFFGFDLDNKLVHIVGDGQTKVSFILRSDVARYIMASLKDPKVWKNKEVGLAAESMTFLKVSSVLNEKFGEFKVEHETVEDALAKIEDSGFGAETVGLQLQVAASKGNVYFEHPDNDNFPHIEPISIDQYLNSLKPE